MKSRGKDGKERTSPHCSEVAVVIPVWRTDLSPDEKRSLSTVRGVLSAYPRIFVVPQTLELPPRFLEGEELLRFPDRFFTYPHGYNRLLLSPCFFDPLVSYDYILLYQLDCLVLSDQLREWCAEGYDYVGAPWHDDHGRPAGDNVWRVGNGGFSLRKVATARAILAKRIRRGSLFPIPPVSMPQPRGWDWFRANARHRLRQHTGRWTIADELACAYYDNEDRFWAIEAPRVWGDYTVPEVNEALGFAFEREPRECMRRNGGKMPFGCHAWTKHDRQFWESSLP